MQLKLVDEYDTTCTQVFVYESDQALRGEKLYVIVSVNKTTLEEYIRYGNYTQAMSLKKSYKRPPEVFKLL